MKLDRKVLKFKTRMYKHEIDSRSLLYFIRTGGFGPAQLSYLLNEIWSGKLWGKDQIFGNLLPKDYSDLHNRELSYIGDSLKAELEMNFVTVGKYSSYINTFLNLQDNFEQKLLLGEYDVAREILDEIEQSVCVSMWTLQSRFLLSELKDGVEGNKLFLSHVNNQNSTMITSVLAEFYSFKSEKDTSFQQYLNRVSKILEVNSDFQSVVSYIRFKLLPHPQELEQTDILGILYFEAAASIIDRYLTLIRISQLVCSDYYIDQTNKAEIKNIIQKNVQSLNESIVDPSLERLRSYFQPTVIPVPSETTEMMLSACDLYTSGDYENTGRICERNLQLYSNHLEVYELFVKSAMFVGNEQLHLGYSLHEDLIDLLTRIYTKDPEYVPMQRDAYKKSLLIDHFKIGQQLLAVLAEQTSVLGDSRQAKFSEFLSFFANPRFSTVFSDNTLSEEFLHTLLGFYGPNSAVALYEIIAARADMDSNAVIPGHRRLRYVASTLENLGKLDVATSSLKTILLEMLDSIPWGARRYIYEKVTVALFNVYQMDRNFKNCLSLYVDNYLADPVMVLRMDLSALYSQVKRHRDKALYADINLPILSYLYLKTAYTDIHRFYANFLDSHGLRRPTDLLNAELGFEKEKLVFFLRYICSVEVMQHSLAFDNPEDVRKERISVCQQLISLDEENHYEYVREIGQITHKLSINIRAKQIDQSRIDIDTKGIKEDPDNLFAETFNRYKRLENVPVIQLIDIYTLQDLKLNLDNVIQSIKSLKYKQTKYVLFKEAFSELRDQFCFNQKFGLDSSLSTRIRHGALMGQLRRPFELHQLILSKRDESSSRYEFNKYWIDLLDFFPSDQDVAEEIREIFEKFSKQIDEQINQINAIWMRINTETKPSDGLFNFKLTDNILDQHYDNMRHIDEPEEFFDAVMAAMFDITRPSLSRIRERLKVELEAILLRYLDDLSINVRDLELKYSERPIKKLFSDIRLKVTSCRTEVQNQIAELVEWFRLSENKDDRDFDAQELLDTCIETNRSISPSYSTIEIEPSIDCTSIFAGRTFIYLTDIMNILFNNAVKHSLFDDPKDLKIEIKVTQTDTQVVFRIRNNLSFHVNRDELRGKILETMSKLEDTKYVLQNNAMEGKSGYVKISKILRYNIQNDYSLSLSMPDDDSFEVLLKLNRKLLTFPSEGLNE